VDDAKVDLLNQPKGNINETNTDVDSKVQSSQGPPPKKEQSKKSCCPNLTPFVLMIALSVHSIFEGLALGL